VDSLKQVSFDPGRQHSLPWQSGFAGIAFNPKATGGKAIESVDQLLTDPSLKGKVTLLTEMRDTVGLVLMAMGKKLESFTDADFDAAIAVLQKAKDAGQIKGFTGNDYTKPLASGDTAACFAWTGNVVQLRAERPLAAVSTALAAELYDLEVVASDIEDHPENQTRFVVVARSGIPAPTGHDKSTIVCFQRADQPGSLLAILQEFAARAVNLTKLESRPTKNGLGHYCFIIDLDGHVADELVADALRDLKSKLADVKFLGSYPAAGDEGHEVRRDATASWKRADDWIAGLRADIADR
jgi:prephenate dehydratase